MARLLHGHTVPFFLGLLSTLSFHLQTSRHKVQSDLISLSLPLTAISLTGHSATVNSDKVFSDSTKSVAESTDCKVHVAI